MRRYVMCHQRTVSDRCSVSDFYSAHDDRATAERGTTANDRFFELPVAFGLRLSVGIRRPRGAVVDEDDSVADEHFIFDRHALADECMAGNFAAGADSGPPLNFNECPYTGIVSHFTSVQVDEGAHPHTCPQVHVVC